VTLSHASSAWRALVPGIVGLADHIEERLEAILLEGVEK
jgi:hypothetical protein